MYDFRRLIDVLVVTFSALFIMGLFLAFNPKEHIAAQALTSDDLMQLSKDRAEYYQTQIASAYTCDGVTDLLNNIDLKIFDTLDENSFIVGRADSKKSLFYLRAKKDHYGCKIIAVSVVPDIKRVLGIMASNHWNMDINKSTAFFDVNENLLVQRFDSISHSEKQTVEILRTFAEEVYEFRGAILEMNAVPEKSSI